MRKWLLVPFLFVLAFSASAFKPTPIDVIAYYTGNAETIKNYPVSKLTHIIYSFLHLKDDTLSFGSDKQKATLLALTNLKKAYPKLKVMIALGGWGGCATCSPVFSTQGGRDHFAQSVKRILDEYNADGIDIDWEYPTIPGFPDHAYSLSDKDNFTALMKTLRKTLGKKAEISFAAGGFASFVEESVDWKAVMPYVNRVNLMTYDLTNGNSPTTGHHTPLYSSPGQVESGNRCVEMLLAKGVSSKKLVLGAAFYGRAWKEVQPVNNGLYQSGVFTAFVPYKRLLQEYGDAAGYQFYTDSVSKASWRYSSAERKFITYETIESVKEKVTYSKKKKLGGIMFWELTLDFTEKGLLDAIYDSVNE